MFTIILAVVALADYVIIFCCLVNMVAKPTVRTAETPEFVSEGYETMDCAVPVQVNDDEELNRYIEEQNSRIELLSSNINEILSNIDSIIERSKENQGVLAE